MIFLVVKQINHATPLLHVLPTLFLASVVAVPNAPIGRFLELQPMRIVGNISYSLYIWQQLFLGGSGPRLSTPLAFAAIFLCAFGSRFLIEKPFIRMGKSLLFSQHLPKDGKVA
jgi:peptidoglycan/LPS O-acetylase OafA/YrhL